MIFAVMQQNCHDAKSRHVVVAHRSIECCVSLQGGFKNRRERPNVGLRSAAVRMYGEHRRLEIVPRSRFLEIPLIQALDFSRRMRYIASIGAFHWGTHNNNHERDATMKVSEILQVKGNILFTVTPETPMMAAPAVSMAR